MSHISEKFGNVDKEDHLNKITEIKYDYSSAYIKYHGEKIYFSDARFRGLAYTKTGACKRIVIGIKEIIVKSY